MGMYTELFISTRIKDVPEVIDILKDMISGNHIELEQIPDHPFFYTTRWKHMLRCSSHYFVPVASSLLEYSKIGDFWVFTNRSDFKNYDNEIDLFVDWLNPYIDAIEGEMVGYFRYEEDQEPTILYKK